MARRTLNLSRRNAPELTEHVGVAEGTTPEPINPIAEPNGEAVEYGDTDASDFIAPATATPADNTDSSEPGKRKRGRPAGSNGKSKRTEDKETPENLGDLLYSVHFMLSKICNSELLEIDEDEAKKMGAAIARVSKHTTRKVLSPTQLAWLNLFAVTGTVYGPRVVAYSQSQRAKKNKGKITVMDPAPAPAASQPQPQTIEG